MTARLKNMGTLFALGVALALCACGSDDAGASGSNDSGTSGRGDAEAPSGNGGSGGSRADSGTRAGSGGTSSAGAGRDAADAATADGGAGQVVEDASTSDAGASSDAGAGSDGGGTPGGPMGTQPIGRVCANDGNCSQETGEAVCCVNTCELVQDCPDSPGYLPCDSRSDCAAFGGGKICCELGPQRFCTKQSACSGEIIP